MSQDTTQTQARKYFYTTTLAQLALIIVTVVFTWQAYSLLVQPIEVHPRLLGLVTALLAAVLTSILVGQPVGKHVAAIVMWFAFGALIWYLTRSTGVETAIPAISGYLVWALSGPRKFFSALAPSKGIRFRFRRSKRGSEQSPQAS